MLILWQQPGKDSPPAGNLKKRTACGITCPSVTCPRGTPSWPGWGWGYPSPGWGVPHPDLAGRGYSFLGYPLARTGVPLTLAWVPPIKGPGTSHWDTPGKDMGPVEVLWDGDGVPPRKDIGSVMGWRRGPPWVWTDWKDTSYFVRGGKKLVLSNPWWFWLTLGAPQQTLVILNILPTSFRGHSHNFIWNTNNSNPLQCYCAALFIIIG